MTIIKNSTILFFSSERPRCHKGVCYKTNNESTITGDFNCDYSHVKNDGSLSSVQSIASLFNFEQHVKEATRITSKSKTIDLIFSNKLKSKIISGVEIASVADHLMNFVVLSKHSTKSEHTIIKTRPFKIFNLDELFRDLNNVPWHTVETMDNVEYLWHMWKVFFAILLTPMLR